MQIILLEKITKLGNLGDKVEVKSGYGRNYLLPKGKAVIANKSNIEAFNARFKELEQQALAKKEEALKKSIAIDNKTVTIYSVSGDGGKLFGSIGTADISKAIHANLNVAILKSDVRLPNGNIRSIGEYIIHIALHADVVVPLNVVVESQRA